MTVHIAVSCNSTAQGVLEAAAEEKVAAAAQGVLEAAAEEKVAAAAQGVLEATTEEKVTTAAVQLIRKQRQNLRRKRSFKLKKMQVHGKERDICWNKSAVA